MSKTYKTTLSIEPEMMIYDCERFQAAFVDEGCDFSRGMWANDSIEDACEAFLLMLFNERNQFEKGVNGEYRYVKFIEGLGEFENLKGDFWTPVDKDQDILHGGLSFYLPNDGDVDVEWSCREVMS